MEDQTRSDVLKAIPYGFYITGVVSKDGEVNGFVLRSSSTTRALLADGPFRASRSVLRGRGSFLPI